MVESTTAPARGASIESLADVKATLLGVLAHGAGWIFNACSRPSRASILGHDRKECRISGADRNALANDPVGVGFHQDRFGCFGRGLSSADGVSPISGLSAGEPRCDVVLLRFPYRAVSVKLKCMRAIVAFSLQG